MHSNHEVHRNAILVFFSLESMKSKTSINNSMLSVLPAAQVLAENGEFCGSRNFDLQTYQLLNQASARLVS